MNTEIKSSAEKVNKKTKKSSGKPKLIKIKTDKLHPFKNHPYKVLDDDSMKELKDSISKRGFMNRIIVCPIKDTPDEYEIISGHRRVYAAKLLGIKEVPAVVYSIDRDEATVLMVDCNIQREALTPMEKANAYRMKRDALYHQGKTCGQNGQKSRDNVSETDSGRTVQRYIRLTCLVPELQDYVDNGQMKMLPAVEISYLDEEAQRDIVDRIIETEVFPSHAQARKMKALFEEGKLDYETVAEIMSEPKPNQVEKLKIPMDDIRKYLPSSMTPAQMSLYILNLAKKEFERQRSRNDAR